MLLNLPILVEERSPEQARLNAFVVRPLFIDEHTERADKLSRALNKLSLKLHDWLAEQSKSPLHQDLAWWIFHPPLESKSLRLRLELRGGSWRREFFFVGYPALDRKLWFTPLAPDLHFEVHSHETLSERAVEVLTHHFRRLEAEEIFDFERFDGTGRMRLTTLELEFKPAAVVRKPQQDRQAFFFAPPEKKEGAAELRRVGQELNRSYPDDLEHAGDREPEIAELAGLLAGTERLPAVLVGPQKVGKTAIIHELTRRICRQPRTKYAGGRKIWLLSPMRLISGMVYLGEWENRVTAILDHAADKDLVLYFEDLPGLLTAGISSASSLNVAQVLKRYLEKRSVRVLAEITPEAWRVLREKARDFADMFQVIHVRETTSEATTRILVNVARRLEERHRCEFDLAVLPVIMDLFQRFGAQASFPGKAVAFMQRLAVRFAGRPVSRSAALTEFQEQSGLHPAFLDNRLELKRETILARFHEKVLGQNRVVGAFADVLLKLKSRLHDTGRPLGTFLLLGPTGVGKTQSVRALATYLFGDGERMLRFDMNEYVDGMAAARLMGSDTEEEGLLTGAIRRQPFSVVLFDEIEKAAPEVFDLLLAMLDEGRLTDSMGRVANFTHAMIVLTSNLGARDARRQLGFRNTTGTGSDAVYFSAAEKFFRPEFFNRLDHIIPFAELTTDHLEGIARQLLQEVFTRDGLRRRQCLLHVSPEAVSKLVELGFHPQLGARALKRVVEREVAQPIARRLAKLSRDCPTRANLEVCHDRLSLELVELRPVQRSVSWGDAIARPRQPEEHKHWAQGIAARTEIFLDRIHAALEAMAPDQPLEVSQVAPDQARYFFCREQYAKVKRVLEAVNYSCKSRRPTPDLAHQPKQRPNKLVLRHKFDADPGVDIMREREVLQWEMREALADSSVEVPDSPVAALLRETALLEAMMAQPFEDTPRVAIFKSLDAHDALPAHALATATQNALNGIWGCEATLLENPSPNQSESRPGFACALWCAGLNLQSLLPSGRHQILHRHVRGTLGLVEMIVGIAPEQADAQRLLESPEPLTDVPSSSGLIQTIEEGKHRIEHRSGLVIPADPSTDQARAMLLSTLALPAEFDEMES